MRDLSIYPVLLPSSNWTEFFKLALSENNYGLVPNVYLIARPGSIYKKLFPLDSVHFIYSNNNQGISKIKPTYDNIWPGFCKNPEVLKECKDIAINDLDVFLNLRYSELIKGGRIYFDLLYDNGLSNDFIYQEANRVVNDFVDQGVITYDERNRIALNSYRRNDEIFDTAFDRHKKSFNIISQEVHTTVFPAWSLYQITKDSEALARSYADWIKESSSSVIFNSLETSKTQEDKKKILKDLYEELYKALVKSPTGLNFTYCHYILEKI